MAYFEKMAAKKASKAGFLGVFWLYIIDLDRHALVRPQTPGEG